jgi:TonB family protein
MTVINHQPSMQITLSRVLSLIVVAAVLAGCSSGGAQTEPPGGWSAADGRWWAEGVDTSQVFRRLDSLQTMGVGEGESYAASLQGANPDQFAQAVKEELLALYRNNPEVVDSLFEAYARPDIAEADLSVSDEEEMRNKLNQFKNESYKAISQHFTEPRRQSQELSISYPDSLRREETSGEVEMQLYLNAQGQPQAVELLEGVHPVLNGIAMNAATRTQWQPAYLTRDGEQQPIPSWVRIPINFQPPPGG